VIHDVMGGAADEELDGHVRAGLPFVS